MNLGDTFWWDPPGVGWHLWTVISNITDEGQIVFASITTKRGNQREDYSCVLSPADHPDLKHDSWIMYDRTRLSDVSFVRTYTKPSESFSDAVVERILLGASNTDRMSLNHEEILRDQELIT